jgi:uncharacterized protein DUF5691
LSDFVRAAIVGTAQLGDAASLRTGSAADELVARLGEGDRERAFLLRAGAYTVLRRAARVPVRQESKAEPSAAEARRPTSARLTEILRTLFAEMEPELLAEALVRSAQAQLRLAPELLPLALEQTAPARRALLAPLLGERGLWLARRRPEWSWALALGTVEVLPAEVEQRWAEGTAVERKVLLGRLRRSAPELARKLVAEAWKQEKLEQRQAWLEVIASRVDAEDEPWLASLASERSAGLRIASARLLWRLPGSEVARRAGELARAWVSFHGGEWRVRLPPELYDPAWECDGIAESPPPGQSIGKRQWWLLQALWAVPPDRWLPAPEASRASLLEAALGQEFASVLLDGISGAAISMGSAAWFAPLWDAWFQVDGPSALPEPPLATLTRRLAAEEARSRGLALLQTDARSALLSYLPRPWPEPVAQGFLAALKGGRPFPGDVLSAAALGIAVELLPENIALPDPAGLDPSARAQLRALDRFRTIAAVRRDIAQETVQ